MLDPRMQRLHSDGGTFVDVSSVVEVEATLSALEVSESDFDGEVALVQDHDLEH